MAEKKVTALEQAAMEAKEATVNEQVSQGAEESVTENLVLEREKIKTKRDRREIYVYFVRGNACGREIRADFEAKDQGGYETLDLIFSIKPTAELLMREETMVQDGVKTSYTVYEAYNVDEDGIEYKYEIKPSRKSDKSYLDVMLQQRAKKVA